MTPTLDHIEPAGPDRKARRLVFSDGECVTTAAAVVRALGVDEGSTVPRADLMDAILAEEKTQARERALRILGYRERSEAELAKRLRDDGYSSATVDSTVVRFAELGLVDDARFARLYARSRAASGVGRGRIARELRDRGIEDAAAAEALDEAAPSDDELHRAIRVIAARSVPGDRKQRERLLRRLVSRGYSMSVAMRAIDSLGDSHDLDDEAQ